MVQRSNFSRFSWFLLITGLILLVVINLPQPRTQQEIVIRIDQAASLLSEAEQLKVDEIDLYSCQISLDLKSPRSLQAGRAGQISLIALMRCDANEVSKEDATLRLKLVEDYNQAYPTGEIIQAINTDQVVYFDWMVLADAVPKFGGTLWVYLDIHRSDEIISFPLASIPISGEVRSLLGLQHPTLVQLSAGLAILGFVSLIVDGLIQAVRRKRSKIIPNNSHHQN